MTRKDIALTVGGILATMVLAYLIYRLQQRDAAARAAASSNSQDNADSIDAQLAQQSQEYQQYAELQYQQAQASTSSADLTSAVTTSANTAQAGAGAADLPSDSTDIDNLLSQIIQDYATSNQPADLTTTQTTLPGLTIPIISNGDDSTAALASIPTTANQAQENVSMQGGVNVPVGGSTDAPVASPISTDNTPPATHLTSVYSTHANLSNVHTNTATQQAIEAGP